MLSGASRLAHPRIAVPVAASGLFADSPRPCALLLCRTSISALIPNTVDKKSSIRSNISLEFMSWSHSRSVAFTNLILRVSPNILPIEHAEQVFQPSCKLKTQNLVFWAQPARLVCYGLHESES
nr:hypothetical protein CFP56_00587 [Quercus suber]